MDIKALINRLTSRIRTPVVPESQKVVPRRYRLQTQADFDASPVWRRGI